MQYPDYKVTQPTSSWMYLVDYSKDMVKSIKSLVVEINKQGSTETDAEGCCYQVLWTLQEALRSLDTDMN